MKGSLRSLALKGSLWTVLGYGASNALRLGSNVVLARLLFPEAFGLMVLVAVFVQGLTMFSDVGIGPSIIHSKRGDDPSFLDTAWTVQVVRGVVLAACAWLGADAFAAYYDEPLLARLIPVAGLVAILSGLNSTKIFTVSRHLALGRKTANEVLSQALGSTLMIVWALVDRSVWALVAGSLASAAALMVLSHVHLPGPRNRLRWDPASARELFGFGRWVFVSTLVTFFALQIDRLLLGKLVATDTLGVYGIALTIATLPQIVGGMLTGTVQYPLLARYAREDPASLSWRLPASRRGLLRAGAFALLGVALLSPAFFRWVYDERYAAGVWLAPLMTVSVWFVVLQLTADRACLALGDTRTLASSNLAALAGKLAGGLVGFQQAGLPGFVLGVTCGTALGHLVVQRSLAARGVRLAVQDARETGLFLVTGGLACGLPFVVAPALGLEGRVPRTLLEGGIAACVLLPFAYSALRAVRAPDASPEAGEVPGSGAQGVAA